MDTSGNVYLGGSTSVALPATPGAFRPSFTPCAAVLSTKYNPGHPSCSWAFVGKLAPDGTILWLTYVPEPNGNSYINQIAIDSIGNVYLAGTSATVDGLPAEFPVTPGAFETATGSVFIANLNPSGSTLLYATRFNEVSEIDALCVDANGNLYLGTLAGSPESLPVIDPLPGTALVQRSAYLAKLNPAGTALVFATSLTAADGWSYIRAFTIGLSGDLYITGTCSDGCVRTTPGAFQANVAAESAAVYVMRLRADGTLVYSTLFGNAYLWILAGIAVDGSGNAIVAGHAVDTTPKIPITQGSFQTQFVNHVVAPDATDAAFVAKFNTTGSALSYSTYFNGSLGAGINGFALDAAGNVVFAGSSLSADLPMKSDSWYPCTSPLNFAAGGEGADFVGRLSSDGSTLLYASFIPSDEVLGESTSGSALTVAGIDSGGDLYLFGTDSNTNVLIRYRMTERPKGSAACVTSPADGYETPISPLALMQIRGNGLGVGVPAASLPLTSDGTLPTDYNGLEVWIGYAPLPLVQVEADRITFVAPSLFVAAGSASIFVLNNGVVTTQLETTIEPAAPAVLTNDGSGVGGAAAFNQDGSVNSLRNPALSGSIVSVYLTGLGETSPPLQAGMVAMAPGSLQEILQVLVDWTSADVLYAGPAPGLLAGIYQMNIRIPPAPRGGFVQLFVQAGQQTSQLWAGIYVR